MSFDFGLMMVHALLRLKASGILDAYPNLAAYVARGEARSAFKRAFATLWAVFTGHPATDRQRSAPGRETGNQGL